MFNREILIAIFLFVNASPGWAIVGVHALGGQRQSKFATNDVSKTNRSTEIQLALNVDPIPMVPIAFGGYYILHNGYNVAKDDGFWGMEKLSGSEAGAEMMLWLPLKPTDFSLFLKAGYTFWGKYSGYNNTFVTINDDTNIKYKQDFSSTGTRLAAGFRWAPIAIVSGLLQVEYALETWKSEGITLTGAEALEATYEADQDNIDVTGITILAGFEVGI